MSDSTPLSPGGGCQQSKKLNLYVSWENLRLEVNDLNNPKEKKVILNDLNGHAKPGQLLAVIGPSGSGKSSFLNCIGGRTIDGVTGNLLFNGVKRPSNFARFSGYVVQSDLYFEALSVKETLTFAANLKLPMSMTSQQKKQRVDDVIQELDLTKCQDTQIGSIGKGISGGERRRLAIGLELINEPSLLLLDEPTTGLDSASALMVGKILRRLCEKKGVTIICTIHQPRYALACMFDKLYFLAKGREIYFGASIPKCLSFFENAGYTCPEYDNPADFLLDLVNTALDKNAMLDANNAGADAATHAHAESSLDHSQGSNTSNLSNLSNLSHVSHGTQDAQLTRVGTTSVATEDGDMSSQDDGMLAKMDSINSVHSLHSVTSVEPVGRIGDSSDEASDAPEDRQQLMGLDHNKVELKMPEIGEDDAMKVPQVSRDEIITHLAAEYQKSELRGRALDVMVPLNDRGEKVFAGIENDFYITPWYNQFWVIMVRSFMFKAREPISLMTQVFNSLAMPLMFGSVYWQIDLSQEAALDRLSAISILVLNLSFFAIDILMLFPLERDMFNRENASGMYRPSMFYLGRTFAEMPQHIILSAIMGTIAYFMFGLQEDSEKFMIWTGVFVLTGIAGTSLLLVLSATAKTMEQSNLLITFFLLLFMLFDGNWISLDKVPSHWRWIRHFSLFAHGGQALIVNEYRGLEFKCDDNESGCFATGHDILHQRGLQNVSIEDKVWSLLALIVGFRVLAFLAVLFLYRNKSSWTILKQLVGCKQK